MSNIVQKLMDEYNHHSGELAELLEGAASEIDCLMDEKADLTERVDRLAAEAYNNGELYNKEHLLRIDADNVAAYWRKQYTMLESELAALKESVNCAELPHSSFGAGQKEMRERCAKRLDMLAAEQKRWNNHCAASVIGIEAAAVRSLCVSESSPIGSRPAGA